MNVMVCFRNGISAVLASSTNTKLQRLELKDKSLEELGLNVEFVNLDKRNLSKLLEKKDIKPDYIYLYEDGKSNENDIREFIENNYPDINIVSYMTELDIQPIKNNNIHLFDTEKEADEFILKEIKENVCSIEKDIEDLKKGLEKKETILNRYEAILEQKEQDFANKYKTDIKSKKNIERDM